MLSLRERLADKLDSETSLIEIEPSDVVFEEADESYRGGGEP